MNFLIIIGLVVGFGGLIGGYFKEGATSLKALWQLSAFMIVMGGTIGSTIVSTPKSVLSMIPSVLKELMFPKKLNFQSLMETLVELAIKSRKEGLLVLEALAENMEDPLLHRGLLYVSDGVSAEYLRASLENELEADEAKIESVAKVFETMGGFAPTMGVIGTVMGMVNILAELGGDASELGKKISAAFIATLYGVGTANLLYLPIAAHIKNSYTRKHHYYVVMIEGLISIRNGEPADRIRENLVAKIGKDELGKAKKEKITPENAKQAPAAQREGK